jgi:hypothetical protein
MGGSRPKLLPVLWGGLVPTTKLRKYYMKFSCGLTPEKAWEKEKTYLSNWHNKFLWFPTTIKVKDGKQICCWLETVERKGKYFSGSWMSDSYCKWEYRTKQ